jgi:Ni/Co efflux regulator RcnB
MRIVGACRHHVERERIRKELEERRVSRRYTQYENSTSVDIRRVDYEIHKYTSYKLTNCSPMILARLFLSFAFIVHKL